MEQAMPTTAWNCEDGSMQPKDLSQHKKWKLYCSFLATFVGSVMLGFFVVGPATLEFGAARQSHDQFLSKFVTPSGTSRASVSVGAGYVPPGFTAAEWSRKQKEEKNAKVQNKAKYPKGAPQVLGVKEYLEKLQAKQTFKKNAVGNSVVAGTGHVYVKTKFGDFTKDAYDSWRKKGGKPPNNNMEGRSASLWK